jgi:hypothetical protein
MLQLHIMKDFSDDYRRMTEDLKAPDPALSRRRIWTQIYLPLIIGILVIVVSAVTVVLTGAGDASVWADVSIVFMSLPIFVLSLIFLAASVAVVYALFRLKAVLPIPLRRLRQYIDRGGVSIEKIADRSVQPVLILSGWSGVLGVITRRFRRIFQPRGNGQ